MTCRGLPKAFYVALREGRKLSGSGDHMGAMAAFDQALKAAPGDARALSEVSWLAIQMKDYPRAMKAAHQSITNAKTKQIKAASLYNLGRALEATGDKKGALAAYEKSHALRPHKVVAKRIATLGGKASATVNVAAVAMTSL